MIVINYLDYGICNLNNVVLIQTTLLEEVVHGAINCWCDRTYPAPYIYPYLEAASD
ncbi:hypothetical protein [Nostoc linckia]|nr:hypothetical protein [Nostoc linckia]